METIELRWYQKEAAQAAKTHIANRKNPIIVLPTGAGKTPTISQVIEDYIIEHPGKRVAVLSHVDRILIQNYNTIENMLGNIVGLYSAGLGEKQHNKMITVAGIQSVYRKTELFEDVGLVIVDECHLVNHDNKGMYRNFANAVGDAVFLGMTATPFRLGHGYIHEGEDTLFDSICYNAGSYEIYNKLVEQGYLSKIYSKRTDMGLDLTGVGTVAGDFNLKDLSAAVDRESITENAVKETILYGKKYKKWLFFAIDIEHAEHIKKCLIDNGISSTCVHSKMNEDRNVELAKFRKGYYRAVVNVDILTTGFDEPGIDLIAMLRPTKSPIIHVQTVGRGGRIAHGKDHCLLLDFAGNTERLGPINDVQVHKKKKSKGGGDPITKTCPECNVVQHPKVKICDACGHEFEFKEKLRGSASTAQVLRGDKKQGLKQWLGVNQVTYSIWQKPGKSDSLRVQYRCGLNTYSEWVAYGRHNYAGHLAKNWVFWRWPKDEAMPKNVGELFRKSKLLRVPKRIQVDTSGKYPNIVDAEF